MQQKPVSKWKYKIRSIDQAKMKSSVRPVEAREFLLVEVLLRIPEIFKLYERDPDEFESYWKNCHGPFSQNPLGGSHHALLYQPDKELKRKFLDMGFIDLGLGILDLGTIAKLPAGRLLEHEGTVLYGQIDGGAEECKLRLQSQNPKFLHLGLDVSQPPEAIIECLGRLLHSRYLDLRRGSKNKSFQYNAVRKPTILTRLKFLQCYDLRQEGRSIDEIADIAYAKDTRARGNSKENARRAIRRATAMIEPVRQQLLDYMKRQERLGRESPLQFHPNIDFNLRLD